MVITLPLALIGLGLFIYLLFAAASYALPLLAGLSAGFAADHAGFSGIGALLLGTATFMLVIAVGRMATLLLPSPYARIAVMLLFAVPAAIAGFQVASALLHLSDVGPWGGIAALATALVTAPLRRSGTVCLLTRDQLGGIRRDREAADSNTQTPPGLPGRCVEPSCNAR